MTSTAHQVLVVDDQANTRDLLAEVLRLEGYGVATASNGAHAMALLDSHPPDVILLDLMMPVIDGFAFRGKQLLSPHLASIPVIVLSARFFLDGELERLRPFAWLAKPFDVGLVLRAVASACAGNASGTPTPAPAPAVEVDHGRSMLLTTPNRSSGQPLQPGWSTSPHGLIGPWAEKAACAGNITTRPAVRRLGRGHE